MAAVVGLAVVIGDEAHRVSGLDQILVFLGELFDGIPERWDGSLVFVEGNREA